MNQTEHLDEPDKKGNNQYLTYFEENFRGSAQAILPIINHIPLAICVIDSEGKFEQVNDDCCILYQYARNELIGQHFTKIVPKANKAKLKKQHKRIIESKEEITDIWKIEQRDGTLISTMAYLTHIAEDNQTKLISFLVDISNTKKVEASLKKTVKKMNDLMMSQENAMELLLHDLRGPMSNILSLAEFLSNESFNSTQKDEFAKRLQQSAQRAFNLTNRLYGIMQIENGKYKPTHTVFDLHALINEIWDDLSILVRAKKLTLRQKINTDTQDRLLLNTDSFLINIIFYNLIKNAVEAAPKEKEVSILLKEEKKALHVEIHNEGEIPIEVEASFFQKYITSGKARGSGLGTYMVKKATHLLKSKVSFKSSAEEGTTLYLKFPTSFIYRQETI